jgi:hypothetical protein
VGTTGRGGMAANHNAIEGDHSQDTITEAMTGIVSPNLDNGHYPPVTVRTGLLAEELLQYCVKSHYYYGSDH